MKTLALSLLIAIFSWPAYAKASGSLDSTFANGGVLSLGAHSDRQYMPIRTFPDGSFLVSYLETHLVNGVPQDFPVLIKFTSNGQRDLSFGANGQVRLAFLRGGYRGDLGIFIYPDGAMLIGANQRQLADDVHTDGILVKLSPSGEKDTSFGNGTGMIREWYFPRFDKVAVDRNGIIHALVYGPERSYLVRYSNDGSTRLGYEGFDYGFSEIAPHAGGVILAGPSDSPYYPALGAKPLLRKITSGGRVAWTRSLSMPGNSTRGDFSLKVLQNGQISLLACSSTSSGTGYVYRVNGDGTMAEGFGNNGVQKVSAAANAFGSPASAVQTDGKIIFGSDHKTLTRLHTTGYLDLGFDTGGLGGFASSLAIQSNSGKILVGVSMDTSLGARVYQITRRLP